jgi:hypothetical protein
MFRLWKKNGLGWESKDKLINNPSKIEILEKKENLEKLFFSLFLFIFVTDLKIDSGGDRNGGGLYRNVEAELL